MQNFSELALSPQILRAVTEMGFETPSPIQAQAIPRMLEGPTDFLGLAGTGTGKTAAFAIPLLSRIDYKKRNVQSLILCPTRELAMQVAGQIELLGKYVAVRVATVYGGAPYGDQIRALRGGAQVVVGTPGRVIDHLEKQTLILDDVTTLILDEADEMFSMGFKEEIDKVVDLLADSANTWLFSATMSPEVRRVVERSLTNPVTVQVSRSSAVSANVEQLYYRCQEFEKPEMICKLIEAADDFYGIIFCQTKALVADLTRFMLDRGYKVDCLHGDMDQNSRERTMQAFRDKKLSVLVCTDVAARGLDVKDITHVVNYSLPRELENYVHRIGRTARSGKTGIVMNLVTFSHRNLMYRIESHTKAKMTEAFVPGKREIAARKVARLLPTLMDQPVASRALEVMGEDFRAALAEMSPEDVASRFIVMMMPDIFGGAESRETKRAKKSAAPVSAAKPVAPAVAVPAKKIKPILTMTTEASVVETLDHLLEAEPAELQDSVEMGLPKSPTVEVSAVETQSVEVSTAEPQVEASAVEPTSAQAIAAPAVDVFGDEVKPKKKSASSIDEPPRPRKKQVFNEDELEAMLNEEPVFGVRKEREVPRSQSQFRTGPRESRFQDTRPRASSSDSRPSRPGGARSSDGFGPRGDSRPSYGASRGDTRPGSRFERASRPMSRPEASATRTFDRAPRGEFSSRPVTRPSTAPRAARPEAPMNLGKPPKHEAGPARNAREGETGGLNRRARRAALFGRTIDGTSEA